MYKVFKTRTKNVKIYHKSHLTFVMLWLIIYIKKVIKLYRYKIEELKKWKNSEDRKPLILKGARQVGKTWLMKEFGKNETIVFWRF